MKFYAVLSMAAGAIAAATPQAAVPSIQVQLFQDTSTTSPLCSSGATPIVTVQNNTCTFGTPGFNSYKITSESNLPAGKQCALFVIKGSQCGSGTLVAGLALNGTEINKCEPARNGNGVVANQLFLECPN